jgi:peptidoglycan/LPS O-acetylase OafA/YrhL
MSFFRQSDISHWPRRASGEPLVGASNDRLIAIDGMRAMAMLMVYVYHSWEFGGAPALQVGRLSLGAIINGFTAGVDLFIVLSGFCLFWPLVKRPLVVANWNGKDFADRRMRRILPAYLASMVFVTLMPNFLVCIFKLLHIQAKWQKVPSIWQYVTHLTFTHTLFPGTWDGIQGTYWSLGLEAQLYVMFPLVVWGFRKMGISVLIPMIVVSLIYRSIGAMVFKDSGWTANFLFSITFLGRWMEFGAGMLAAWLVVQRQSSPLSAVAGTSLCAAAVLLYCLAVSHLFPDFGLFSLREVLLSLAYAGVAVAMCASRTSLRVVLENRVLAFLGLISYSIFLLHQNMIFYFSELLKKILHLSGDARFAILITVGFAMTVAISYASYLLLERPFFTARSKSSVAVAGPRGINPGPGIMPNNFQPRDAVA